MKFISKLLKNIPKHVCSVDELVLDSGTNVFLIKDSKPNFYGDVDSSEPSSKSCFNSYGNYSIDIFTRDDSGRLLCLNKSLGTIYFLGDDKINQYESLIDKKISLIFGLKSELNSKYPNSNLRIADIVNYSKLESSSLD